MKQKDQIMSSLGVRYSSVNSALNTAKDRMNRYWQAKNGAIALQSNCWQDMQTAHQQMNDEYDRMQASYGQNQSYWDEYGLIRDRNNSEIERLKYRADSAHQNMSSAYDRASSAYNYGDKASAPSYAEEGRRYKAERDELNDHIKELGQEVKSAKKYAQSRASRYDNNTFKNAKRKFEEAKKKFEDAKSRAQIAKDNFSKAKQEFERLKSELESIKNQQAERIKELKSQTAKRLLNDKELARSAGVPIEYLDSVKVRHETDGTVNFYFGGFDKSDGIFHGHISTDSHGNVTYSRMPMKDHGAHNYKSVDKSGWGPYIRGSIDGYEVTARKGFGENKGHTLIADGHKSSRSFSKKDSKGNRQHNHYGPKREGSGYVDEDRGYYTGPDH